MSRLADVALVVAATTAALLAAPRPARACGPDFPVELLRDRDDTLLALPEGMFLDEVARLVPAPAYAVVAAPDPDDNTPAPASGSPPSGTALERALYETGARAFHAGDLAGAERAFVELLALPPAVRHARSTWAAYMLGRLRDGAAAIAAYQQVRALADAGFLDEGGLAASSLGQEARLQYHADTADRVDGTVRALHLYAAQAALGHPDGATSLLFVIRALATRPAAERVDDPLAMQLLAIYLATRTDELDPAVAARLTAHLTAVGRHAGQLAGADHLAATAYRHGQWSYAEVLIGLADDTPRARWVRAKLALRAGDTATAERLLGGAQAGFADAPAERDRVGGERAAVALVDGRIADAMDHAWAVRATYPDAIYLAERVLTLDELTAFVDQLPAPAAAASAASADDVTYQDTWGLATPALLRDLLGRRLMRAGRFAEANAYLAPSARYDAWRYGGAVDAARTTADPIDRAGLLYRASLIARRRGLEILGTSHAPDWSLYDAQYDPYAWDEPQPPRWHGAAEDARVAASAPASPERYHYRFIASELAEEAAELLPHQSQAFAATLCVSARHVVFRDPERVEALWARYVDEGPMVGMDFGQACPEPELERARRFLPPPPEPQWPLAVVGALCLVGAVLLVRRLRPGRFAARP